MTEKRGRRIQISGIVQGVGFRPFVYSLAQELALNGWVRNTSAGVEIEAYGPVEKLDQFAQTLQHHTPPLAHIAAFHQEECLINGATHFHIRQSQAQEGAFQPISPDVSLCPDCLQELFDPADRRYRYPFINCTNCGPRLTIIQDIPYDRPKTTMAGFVMCPDCTREYEDPADRRFHAQPVACPHCGPQIWLETAASSTARARGETALQEARRRLAQGQILAVKGLGGFHLACDATNQAAVQRLRRRKKRFAKPLAVMVAGLEQAGAHSAMNSAESALLTSRQRPIVLLKRSAHSSIAPSVAPGQQHLGLMLPYTPLHYLLLEPAAGFPTALVMTSGNLSEEPIAYENNDARRRLDHIADAFLLNNRDIHTRCDDSVVRLAPDPAGGSGAPYLLRRSRGYAPAPLHLAQAAPPLLACGAELKNTFCLARDHFAFLSHHIGDLENYETLQAFEAGVAHFEHLFRVQPRLLAYDRHPNYLASRYALRRAEEEGLPAISIQHHHAHAASVIAEHGLPGDRPLLGVIFDGTGYGDDGAIWGGEFLLADLNGFRRLAHLSYVPLPGGDAAVRQPWRLALAWLRQAGQGWDEQLAPVQAALGLAGNLSPRQPRVKQLNNPLPVLARQLEKSINTPPTSSMGRLFDAVASLAGVRQQVDYEAQAAMELEALVDPAESGRYSFTRQNDQINPAPLIQAVASDVQQGATQNQIAARFHNGVSQMVLETCRHFGREMGCQQIALSGGVWQNMYLLQQTVSLLTKAGFTVYLQHRVPANDGGLALGQAAVAAWQSS